MQALDLRIYQMWRGTDLMLMDLIRKHEDAVLRHVARHNAVVANHHRNNTFVHPAHMHRAHILRGRL